MSKENLKLNLPSYDSIFTTQEERDDEKTEKIQLIPIDKIKDFPNHPFRVERDDKMEEMVNSIKNEDVVHPVIVRHKDDGSYEMISGHRRKYASMLAGKKDIKAIVRNLTDDEATILMVDSNIQREQVLPSEKAFAYRMKLEAMKHQGKRTDIDENETCVENQHKLKGKKSRDIIAEQSGESADKVRAFIRLTELITPILDMVDEKTIAFRPAVELSYLPKELQTELLDVMQAEECTPSLSQAQRMKAAAQEGKLDRNGMELVIREEKPQQNNITIKGKKLDKYFPKDFTPAQKEERIIKALDLYCRRLERMKSEHEHER